MSKSFYHYILKHRNPKPKDPIQKLANDIFNDIGFPKASTDYYELTNYLELNGYYIDTMDTFDRAWQNYEEEV
ncbi:YozE family protein [Bacillus sp. HMF5848]|uniref:YozE family protein n=1 Tax=Bacillus sp. HMF5848 TaxID=2495421 RepID=UPI000F7B2DF3|nr:YozE family protein [Bacillus sp. HMF5848]RSK27279.1 YozE family protein [Bacillus sp. HMF5848]